MFSHKRIWRNSKRNKDSRTWSRRALSALFVTVMAVTLLSGILAGNMGSVQADTTLKNPRKDSNGVVTWDCVYFGRYPQSDATGKTKDPIKWRVLSVDGNDAFLVADTNLDVQMYNDTYAVAVVTWETCTMRSWLNGYGSSSNVCSKDYSGNNFIDRAFTASEQKTIKTTDVVNADNPVYGTAGGNSTQDKIFMLSYDEVTNPAYGFSSNYSTSDDARKRINTAYVAKGGTIGSSYMGSEVSTDWWWLRSPGNYSYDATFVDSDGAVNQYGSNVYYDNSAVCPALHLNLSSSNLWFYAGTVSSNGNSTEVAPPTTEEKTTEKNITEEKSNKNVNSPQNNQTIVRKGTKKNISNMTYKVTNVSKKTVTCMGTTNKKTKSLVIPATVKINKKTYKVTAIADNAFKGNKKIKKVTIGKNITTIGKNAFNGCNKLKTIEVRSKKIKKVGKNAFKGIVKNPTLKTDKKYKSKYMKMFQG